MRRSLLLLGVVAGLSAQAADVWTTPYPGVRMLKRTTPQPVVFWALVIDSCAPGVRFRASAPSEGNRRTSSFGRLVGAQLAINGDFADHDFGLNLGSGQAWPGYPDTTHSGNFSVGPNRLEMTPDATLLPAPYPWVTEQLGGRWTLLDDGAPRYGIDDNGPTAGGFVCAPGLRHPRTAIGLSRDKRTVVIVVADGRSSSSIGMTCDELIDVFRELGAHDAMGLDGGGSSTLWRNDQLINHPSDATGERTVRNHLGIYATGSGPAPHCGLQQPPEPAQAAAVASPALPRLVALTAPGRFTVLPQARLFDSRTAATSARLLRADGSLEGPVSPTSAATFGDWAAAGLPVDATSAWLNVAAIGHAAPGFVTAHADGRATPPTSNVNFSVGGARANAAAVTLGTGGRVVFTSSAAADLIVDLGGAFGPRGAGLEPRAPVRVLDTRSPALPLQALIARPVDVRAPQGAVGVAASLTVIAGGSAGYLTAFPCGAPTPATSSVNFAAGEVVTNAVLSGLGNGQLCLVSTSAVDVVLDVTGFLQPAATSGYVPVQPVRLLDTRGTSTPYTGRVAAWQVLTLPLQALPGAPANVTAVVANVTVTNAAGPGYLTAFPCGQPRPATSAVTFDAEGAVGSLTVMGVGPGGLCLAASTRAHVLVDVQGVWAETPAVDAGTPELDAGTPDLDAGTPPEPVDAGTPTEPVRPEVSDAGLVAVSPTTEPAPLEPSPLEPVQGASCAAADGLALLGAAALLRRRRGLASPKRAGD